MWVVSMASPVSCTVLVPLVRHLNACIQGNFLGRRVGIEFQTHTLSHTHIWHMWSTSSIYVRTRWWILTLTHSKKNYTHDDDATTRRRRTLSPRRLPAKEYQKNVRCQLSSSFACISHISWSNFVFTETRQYTFLCDHFHCLTNGQVLQLKSSPITNFKRGM